MQKLRHYLVYVFNLDPITPRFQGLVADALARGVAWKSEQASDWESDAAERTWYGVCAA